MRGFDVVLHTATLHKPHVATHPRDAFVATNNTGTLTILEAALAEGVRGVVFTITTSVFGVHFRKTLPDPLCGSPKTGLRPRRTFTALPKSRRKSFVPTSTEQWACLRSSCEHRVLQEPDDDPKRRGGFADANLKANELLYRRVEIADAVDAHLLATNQLATIGFGRYIISATTPFTPEHCDQLRGDVAGVIDELVPSYKPVYEGLDWKMLKGIDRVYVNRLAREELGWSPKYDFASICNRLRSGEGMFSPLVEAVGKCSFFSHRHSLRWRSRDLRLATDRLTRHALKGRYAFRDVMKALLVAREDRHLGAAIVIDVVQRADLDHECAGA